ncbi:hypothetical protein ACOMHN_038750 [Nucella lapillus]
MSSKRDRRSRSGSRSPASSKSKRVLDLVSTRRYSPPGHHYQPRNFRGRPRRPFVHRGSRGVSVFRGTSERYYPRRQRYGNRGESFGRRRRSHSRSHSHGRSARQSGPRDRRQRSESKSSSSGSVTPERHPRSKSRDQHRFAGRDDEETGRRGSQSLEDKAPVKKKPRRHASPSSDKDSSRSGSQEKHRSHDRGQHRYGNRHEEEQAKYSLGKRHAAFEEEEDRAGGGYIPGIPRHCHRRSGKELIPRNRLHKIFSLISQDSDFELDEDISIAIQRNPYAEPSEDSTVTVVFAEELFSMIYPYEGRKHKPIFDREEIKMFAHDKNLADDPDFERRVIRVKPGKSSQHSDPGPSSSSSYQYKSSLEITRTVKRNQSGSRSRSRSASPARQRNPQFRLRVSTDPRFEARYADLHRRGEMGASAHHSDLDPHDLRHELSSGRKSSDRRSRMDREKDRHGSRPMSPEERDNKAEQKKDAEDLPDYSRRKDKYQYTPWLDQPELIPKDPKYFMHDDREIQESRFRGRGGFMRGRYYNYRRPFRPYRGRGNFRGPYRGRGNYNNDPRNDPRPRSPRRQYTGRRNDDNRSVEREWKHDKFSELETDRERPTHGENSQHPHSTSDH